MKKIDKQFLKDFYNELEVLYEVLIPLKDNKDPLDVDFLFDVITHANDIDTFVNVELIANKEQLCCLCGVENILDKIILLRDKILEIVNGLEFTHLQNEFTNKMFKMYSSVLFERRLGFLINKETYNKILGYIQINNLKEHKNPVVAIVVKHPAFPYSMSAKFRPADYLKRIATSKTFYNSTMAPYLYLDIENFNDDEIHAIEVMNYTNNYNILSYFTYYGSGLKSEVVELVDLDNVPMDVLMGNIKTVANNDEKQMSFHQWIKFVYEKTLDSATYNKRYIMVKYNDGYLLRDLEQPEEQALLIAKDENALDKMKNSCGCACRHPIKCRKP